MTPSEKASDRAERLLIEGILEHTYPPGSDLPGERDLSKALGVARPALREALQRLARDGWLDIQQGKATRVNDFMQDGNLNILISLLQADVTRLPNFVPNLLEMWSLLAPTYTYQAIQNDPQSVYRLLSGFEGLADQSVPTVRAQWRVHSTLIECGDNPVYGLILNSFREFYMRLARYFFLNEENREEARAFWRRLHVAAHKEDAQEAADLMADYMGMIRGWWQDVKMEDVLASEWEYNAEEDEEEPEKTDN